ncbi:MAG: polysaccharide deacetylase family protein [Candidatus Marinimicrobia bacterium]|nr:polysaccharide deacetylase family protein [Candidatus Neomarinimicrobiota bacterium]
MVNKLKYPVLAYHKITKQWEISYTMLYPHNFERQMRYLATNGYVGKSLREYLTDPKYNYFVLTFDDAYESVYKNAYPLLKELGFSATVFVLTNYIGKNNTWDFTPGNIFSRHMNVEQLKTLHQEGWEVASHGENHRAMTGLHPDSVIHELKHSKELISSLIDDEVETFCFPFGVYNANVVAAAKSCGYKNLVGFTEPSRYGVISRSAVYRTVDSRLSVLRKIRRYPFDLFFEGIKEGIIHSFSLFSRLAQRFRKSK